MDHPYLSHDNPIVLVFHILPTGLLFMIIIDNISLIIRSFSELLGITTGAGLMGKIQFESHYSPGVSCSYQ